MNKIVYWIGVYAICVYVHESILDFHEFCNEKYRKYERRKDDELGKGKSGKVQNRIGFVVEGD